MINLMNYGAVYENGALKQGCKNADNYKKTMAYRILASHDTSDTQGKLRIKFDAMASHDITYVGIIQTARATGCLESFPIPYVLTNCHNSLCAVGGTINEDDHRFGLSACKKYGGIFVPAHESVIHSYMRECFAAPGKMIIGSDSHTRYGALGTLGIGEGGPELVKQLVGKTYDIDTPEVVAVYLTGQCAPYVGPHDVALALIGATFASGFVKNRILEFIGPGVSTMSQEFRNGIDVMTTETTCLSSVWETDEKTEGYLSLHQRGESFKRITPEEGAYYDRAIRIDLSKVEPMIALPFHPSNVFTISEFKKNAADILRATELAGEKQLGLEAGRFKLTDKLTSRGFEIQQGVIAGCAGGIFDNITAASDILDGADIGAGEFSLSVYPASQPAYLSLIKCGAVQNLMRAGVTLRTAFCGPCFGAGDVPSDGSISIRHSTRNFPSREGSKPGDGQLASVALMDARSIAATARMGGVLTSAAELDVNFKKYDHEFDPSVYKNRVYNGYGKPLPEEELKYGPGIADWPKILPLADNMLITVCSVIEDEVTTTDELIPSGETSSYRSNPYKLSEYTLSRRDPGYVARAKAVRSLEENRQSGTLDEAEKKAISDALGFLPDLESTSFGSAVCAKRPGDGSAREQAASCQRVLGGCANIANDYATKRYRSNLINWGMIPFTSDAAVSFKVGDRIFVAGVRDAVESAAKSVIATVIDKDGKTSRTVLTMPVLTEDEKRIILDGCLINRCRNI